MYYNNKKSSVHEYFLVGNTRRFPELYTTVRKHVDSKYKQVNDGGSIYNTSEIIEYTAKYYNHKVNAKEHVSWGLYADKGTKNWITIIHYYGQHQVEHMVVIQWLYVGISTIQKHQVGGYLK